MSYELIQLGNGTYSVRSLAYGETMHPAIGPVAEAEALYVDQLDLRRRAAQHTGPFVIWDIGLGAAANAIAAIRSVANLHLVSFDNTVESLRFALNHSSELSYLLPFQARIQTLLSKGQVSFERVTWHLQIGNFPEMMDCSLPAPDAILFDPFSPAKNPEMWTAPVFKRIFGLLKRPCSLANFSRSTMFRVSLLLAGFFVGRGRPIARKEETTIAANTPLLICEPLDARWLERAERSHSAEPLWTAIYRKEPLSPSTLEKIRAHPQFSR